MDSTQNQAETNTQVRSYFTKSCASEAADSLGGGLTLQALQNIAPWFCEEAF